MGRESTSPRRKRRGYGGLCWTVATNQQKSRRFSSEMLKRIHREDASALLSRIYAVETNPHPDPLPFTKGEGNLRWHHARVTEQGSRQVRRPLPARSGERIKVRGASDCMLTAKVKTRYHSTPICDEIAPS